MTLIAARVEPTAAELDDWWFDTSEPAADKPDPGVHHLMVARPAPMSVNRIKWAVGAIYLIASLIIFRQVVFAIPSVLRGDSVIVGDELVPFFNPKTQLLSQAAGEFNELTHGYEFRVRYSFLTTWLRYYLVLPFAIVLVIPAIFYAAYLSTARFVSRVFTTLSAQSVYLATFFPVSLFYMIVAYAKITHFYTLMLGLAMFTIAVLNTLYALLFAGEKWTRTMVFAAVVMLLNPAVHYLILYVLFLALAITTLLVGELAYTLRQGGWAAIRHGPAQMYRSVRQTSWVAKLRRPSVGFGGSVTGRCLVSGLIVLFVTLVPYAVFVKFVALRGVPNLSETVPGDYYFISDASVSWLHLVSWDLAGILDKVLYGDYLAKVPRWRNLPYTLLLIVPLLVRPITRSLFVTRPHRQLLGVLYVLIGFSFWASIGYAQPDWVPSFHRTIAHISLTADSMNSPLADLTLKVTSTVVQVLRFPHRFQLVLFTVGPLVMTLTLAWGIDRVSGRLLGSINRRRQSEQLADDKRARGDRVVAMLVAAGWLGLVFFAPFLSNENYRQVYASGDFGTFLAPFPVGDLREVKSELVKLPQGKTIVLPPTETSKRVLDANGITHKLIDKFYIYFLDQPSYYYGLTGDSTNKFEFFLMLRGIYYKQDWWVNIARDLDVRYIIADRSLTDNEGVGAEYLPGSEDLIEPALKFQSDKFTLRFENRSFALYELVDPPPSREGPPRPKLLIDTSWSSYLDLVYDRLNLSQCYDFEYLPYFKPVASTDDTESPDGAGTVSGAESGETALPMTVLTDDPKSTAIDLYLLDHPKSVGTPDQKIFAFNSNIVASSYYLSPMFRSFLLFSNTKWNRTDIITPGVFGTLRGSFIGVPRATRFDINVKAPADGRYRVYLRSAVTVNDLEISSATIDFDDRRVFRSGPNKTEFFDVDTVFTKNRQPVDLSGASPDEVRARLDDDVVPANLAFEYQDLGVVDVTAGMHQFSIVKRDDNPLLVDSMALIPVDEADRLTIGDQYLVAESAADLGCNERLPVRSNDAEYVDSAANDPNADLSEAELRDLAAAGVETLEPPTASDLGRWLMTMLQTVLVILAGVALIAWRARRQPDLDEPAQRSLARFGGAISPNWRRTDDAGDDEIDVDAHDRDTGGRDIDAVNGRHAGTGSHRQMRRQRGRADREGDEE